MEGSEEEIAEGFVEATTLPPACFCCCWLKVEDFEAPLVEEDAAAEAPDFEDDDPVADTAFLLDADASCTADDEPCVPFPVVAAAFDDSLEAFAEPPVEEEEEEEGAAVVAF